MHCVRINCPCVYDGYGFTGQKSQNFQLDLCFKTEDEAILYADEEYERILGQLNEYLPDGWSIDDTIETVRQIEYHKNVINVDEISNFV